LLFVYLQHMRDMTNFLLSSGLAAKGFIHVNGATSVVSLAMQR
jgi:hypothetical protein